jgi:hypothetical protein
MSFYEVQTKKGPYVINSAYVVHFQSAPGGYQYGGIITYQKGQLVDELELRAEDAAKFRTWLIAV